MKRDLGLLLLRLGAGVTLMAHGYPKLFGGPEKEPPQAVAGALGPNFAPAVKQGGPESFAQVLAQTARTVRCPLNVRFDVVAAAGAIPEPPIIAILGTVVTAVPSDVS